MGNTDHAEEEEEMSRLHPTYRVQRGCHDCLHCERICEYDDAPTHYCAFGAPKRPLCGSTAMKESFFERGVERSPERGAREHARVEAWYDWKEGREVETHGLCAAWERKAETKE